MAWYAPPARTCPPGVNPSWPNSSAKGTARTPSLRASASRSVSNSVHHPGDRGPAALGVEAELACGGLDPARVAHHPGRVQDRVEVRQVGFEHVVCPAELARQQRVQPLVALLPAAGRERGERRQGPQEYPDGGRAGQPADVRGGGQLAYRARPPAGPRQLGREVQCAAAVARVQPDQLLTGRRPGQVGRVGRQRPRGHGDGHHPGASDRLLQRSGDQAGRRGPLDLAGHRDAAGIADRGEAPG